MRFSARQQYCLTTMGVVPWVSRHAVAPEVVVAEEVALVAEASVVQEVALASEEAATPEIVVSPQVAVTPEVAEEQAALLMPAASGQQPFTAQPPESIADLGPWVLSRALAPIHHRGTVFPVLGAAEACLLIIVQQADTGPAIAALEGDAARLFNLMLRSIKLSGRDTRQCILSAEPLATPDMSVAGAAITAQTRAVLVLMEDWPFDASDIAAEPHRARLPGPGPQLPIWRIAHPRHLLQQPLLKRQSWQILKLLSAELSGDISL